jgi:hypothetical protein
MDEDVLPIVFGDKAVAFLSVEPLNRTLNHTASPPFLLLRGVFSRESRKRRRSASSWSAIDAAECPLYRYLPDPFASKLVALHSTGAHSCARKNSWQCQPWLVTFTPSFSDGMVLAHVRLAPQFL